MQDKTRHPLSPRIQYILDHAKPEFLYEDLCKLLDFPRTVSNKALIFENEGTFFIIEWKDGKRQLTVTPVPGTQDEEHPASPRLPP